MKTIHPAIAEHAMQESERLSEALRATAKASSAAEVGLIVDAALSQQAEPCEFEWPKLSKPAKVGPVRFNVGVSSRAVVEAAQRRYEYEVTPEKEAERIAAGHASIAAFWEKAMTEPAPAQDELVVYRAVNQFGSDCHFGVESLARVWAGPKGTVERVTLKPAPDLSVVAVRPAQTEQQPVAWRWMYNGEPDGPYAFNYPLPDDDVVQRGLMAERPRTVQPLYAAPIAQTAPQPEQSGWISVEDRLPEVAAGDEGEFIVCVYRSHNGESYSFSARFLNDYPLHTDYEDEPALHSGWYDVKEHADYDGWYSPLIDEKSGDKVTHWMPLPAAPAQGGDL